MCDRDKCNQSEAISVKRNQKDTLHQAPFPLSPLTIISQYLYFLPKYGWNFSWGKGWGSSNEPSTSLPTHVTKKSGRIWRHRGVPCISVERRCHSQRNSSPTAFERAASHVHYLIGIPMPFSPPHVDAAQALLDLQRLCKRKTTVPPSHYKA